MLLSLINTGKRIENPPPILYHYCGMESFRSIISTSTLRLTNATKSNDLTETRYMISMIPKIMQDVISDLQSDYPHLQYIKKASIDKLISYYFQRSNNYWYIVCFSERPDKLSQWVRYADDMKGTAIGIRTNELIKIEAESNKSFLFGKVQYGTDSIKKHAQDYMRAMIEDLLKDEESPVTHAAFETIIETCISSMVYYSGFFKNELFSEEEEWRLLYTPFRKIRATYRTDNFLGCMRETNDNMSEFGGYTRKGYSFSINKYGNLSSYIVLDFSKRRDEFVKDITIGAKSTMATYDSDLIAFLDFSGYKITEIRINRCREGYM